MLWYDSKFRKINVQFKERETWNNTCASTTLNTRKEIVKNYKQLQWLQHKMLWKNQIQKINWYKINVISERESKSACFSCLFKVGFSHLMCTASFNISSSLLGAKSTMEKQFLLAKRRHAWDCCKCWYTCEFLILLRYPRTRVERCRLVLQLRREHRFWKRCVEFFATL